MPEAELEPVELIRQSGLVNRVGRLALSAGHGSYRVKAHMLRIGHAIGLDDVRSQVALTELTTTSFRGEIFRTEVSENRRVGINADRLADMENYIGSLPDSVPMEQIEEQLDRFEEKPHLYRPRINALSAGVACAAFAFLNHGGLIECIIVLLAATIGQYIRRNLISRGINQVGVTLLASAVSCLIYLGLVSLVGLAFAIPGQHEAGYVSAVLFLVPGFPLVTGALDLARLDFSAGMSRLTYALMILGAAALSLWAVSTTVGIEPNPMDPGNINPLVLWTLLAAASFVGVFGFAIMFNSPMRMALGAAVIGMIANVGRLGLVEHWHVAPQASAAVAALMVGLLARAVATPLGVPRLTVSVPAVVIMVPGVTVYRSVFEFNSGHSTAAVGLGVEGALVVIALALGLAVSRMLTDREWTFER
ncbi:MAG: threonine/serine exporter family protein [Cellulomonadaceae bacterium]|nr:threonine/serine exporter family protein [Cellulomonadaceae bacterium]